MKKWVASSAPQELLLVTLFVKRQGRSAEPQALVQLRLLPWWSQLFFHEELP